MRVKLTTFILLLSLVQVSAATFGQRVTLRERKASIDRIFTEIRKQTGYSIAFESPELNTSKTVSANFNNATLETVMDRVLDGTGMDYSIEEKSIIVKKIEKSFIERVIERFQNIDVTGKIVDENGKPIAGATVKIKETSATTVSDGNGIFLLKNIADDAVLQISYLGYQVKEVKASKDLGTLKMEVFTGKLEEVTVNAGYYTVKDSERTGSIARITAKDIETQPVTNVLATMQGRMPGVEVIQNSGMPGGGFKIKIRGTNSLRNDGNNPLYVIDGVPYSSQGIGSTYTSTNMPERNSPLNNLNPDDLESIEVLKDADATAIYGSRGANGVVLITTKKGKNEKTSFSINYMRGLGKVTRYMDLMNTEQYLKMRKEAFAYDKVTTYPASAYDVNGNWSQDRYTDWQKEIIGGTAVTNLFNASLSGGSSQTQYLISANYNSETTVFKGDFKSNRLNSRANFNHVSKDQKLRITFTAGYTFQNNNLPSTDLTRDALSLAPNAPTLYMANGELNWENGTFNNPAAKLLRTIDGKTYDLIANSVISYTILDGLMAKLNLGYTDLRQNQLTILPSTAFNPSLGRGSEFSSVYLNILDRTSWIVEPQLNWNRSFGKAHIEFLAGSTFERQNGSQIVTLGEGFANNSLLRNPASASNYRIMDSNQAIYKYSAIFGRLNFKWDDKYLVNLTGRRDGSSRFGPADRFATFGALGAAWLFAKEPFIEKLSFLSSGKLRASYGASGNDQIGDYQYIDTYTASGTSYQGISGLIPSRLFNPNYGWEINKKLEAALELGLFKDQVVATLSAYQNRSSSQLIGIPLPTTTGFSQLMGNLDANVQNRGFEFSVQTQNINTKNFTWTTNFNITRSRNKLLSFPGLQGSSYANQFVIGMPLNIIKTYQYTGVDPQTGNYIFTDFNADGKFSAVEDKQVIKDLNPKFFGGIQNTLAFKGVTLNFLFQFVSQENFNELYRFVIPGSMSNQPISLVDNWKNGGDVAHYQGYSNSNSARSLAYSRFIQSDAVIWDASYLRLKNISLSYELPKKWTKNFYCRIAIQGQNLFIISKYKGNDPEFNSSGYLPPLKIISSSVQLTF